MKPFFVSIITCLVVYVSSAQYTETINSNRPGASFGAFSVGTNVLQLEGAVGFGNNTHSLLLTDSDLLFFDYAVRYGLFFEQLEIILEGRFLNVDTTIPSGIETITSSASNFETNTIGLKYLVYDPYKNKQQEGPNVYSYFADKKLKWEDLIPAVSVYAGANLLFGDNAFLFPEEPSVSPKVAIGTQNNFGKTVFVMNFIGDKFTTDFPSYSGIFTLTHAFTPRFSIFGEYQTIISDIYSDDLVRGGLAYLFSKDFQVDLYGLTNFKDTPERWLVGLGLSYRFDQWHKDTPLGEKKQ